MYFYNLTKYTKIKKTIKSNNFKTSFIHLHSSMGIVYNGKLYTHHGETQRWKQIKHFKTHCVEDRLQL